MDETLAGFVAEPRDDLCLDFVNTLYWRGSPQPTEALHGIEDLLAWTARSAGIDPAIVTGLGASWRAWPDAGEAAYASAIAVRETLWRLFGATAEGAGAAADDLAAFNLALSSAAPRTRLDRREDRYSWYVALPAVSLTALLSPVLWSAADLLAGPRRDRVRCCANPRCRWMFLDDSKGGRRKWCSMAACGNRAKAHRHYLRRKAT